MAQPRGFVGSSVDRIIAWLLGFPPQRCNYTTQGMRIPVSEGLSRIELAADLLQPTSKPLGTILIISPYGRRFPIALQARIHAARGYEVLMVSSRGTFGSGGEFDAFRTEVTDGKAVVEWMREQPWYTGTFATIGGSYLGYVQWALLCDPPEDMVAAVPVVSPHDFSLACWSTGALNLDIVRWAENIAHQEEPFSIWKALKSRWSPHNIDTVFDSVPFARNIRSHIGERHLWLDDILTKPDISDSYYTPMRLERALERTNIPVLIMGGWYDTFIPFTMMQYTRLQERGCNVSLTVGPWTHMKSATASKMHRQGFDFIEEHLGGQVVAKRATIVEYFVTGAKEWKNVSVFPPSTTPYTFFLQEGGSLTSEAVSTFSGTSSFIFDPRNPTPSIGGNGLLTGGSVDDSALAKREDVLVFDSAPLEDDLEICGQPVVKLAHATDRPFADIFVRVSEVDEKGRSHNVTEIFKRLDPTRDDVELDLGLNYCSHRFVRGKRIRVIIAGGCWPQYTRNHGVENRDNNGSEMHPVGHTVYHNAGQYSKVAFPVVTGFEGKGKQ
jgi:putative CocE/NonD family hydrolase